MKPARAMTPFLSSIKTTLELLSLEPGWNSYNAKAIRLDAVVETVRIISRFVTDDLPVPTVVPRTTGGIQLEWHTDTVDIEVYIDSPDQVRFFCRAQRITAAL